jgi:hypothetical protein
MHILQKTNQLINPETHYALGLIERLGIYRLNSINKVLFIDGRSDERTLGFLP